MTVEIVSTEGVAVNGIVVLKADEVWVTFGARWWALSRWLWWWLTPGKKAWLLVNARGHDERIRVRAVRISCQHLRHGETIR